MLARSHSLRPPALGFHILERRFRRRLVADVERLLVQTHVAPHQAREEDVARLGVERGVDRDPLGAA
jgi:hypothetical protein